MDITQKEFCKQNHISYHAFNRHYLELRKSEASGQSKDELAFFEVTCSESFTPRGSNELSMEITVKMHLTKAAFWKVQISSVRPS